MSIGVTSRCQVCKYLEGEAKALEPGFLMGLVPY